MDYSKGHTHTKDGVVIHCLITVSLKLMVSIYKQGNIYTEVYEDSFEAYTLMDSFINRHLKDCPDIKKVIVPYPLGGNDKLVKRIEDTGKKVHNDGLKAYRGIEELMMHKAHTYI